MSGVLIRCPVCSATVSKATGVVNRSRRLGSPVYCGRVCSGLARRDVRDKADKVAAKAAYDAAYREKNREMLKAKKAAHYAATVDREKERAVRKARMPQHIEYCRRPQYRKWKAQYDRKYRATKEFGEFGEAAIVLFDLQAEILSRATRYEIYLANGTLNKKLNRRRDYDKAFSG